MGNALKIKMGVDSSGVKKGTKEAQGHLNDFQKTVKTVSLKATAAWAAVGTAIGKFAKDVVTTTQTVGDKFEATMGGMKNAYHQFIRNLSSNNGWTNLFSNLKTAYEEGKKTVQMFDALFESKNATDIQVQGLRNQIAELETIRKTAKLEEDRVAAAQKIIELYGKIEGLQLDYSKQQYDANMKAFTDATKMTEEEAKRFIVEYGNNAKLIAQAEEYNALREKGNSLAKLVHGVYSNNTNRKRFGPAYEENSKQIREFEAGVGEAALAQIKDYLNLVEKYNLANDELVVGVKDSLLAYLQVTEEVTRGAARSYGTINKYSDEITDDKNTGKIKDFIGLFEDESEIKEFDDEMAKLGEQMRTMKIPSFWDDLLGSLIELHPELEQINEDILKIANEGMAEVNERMGPLYDKIQAQKEMMASVGESLYNSLVTSMSDSISYLAEAMGSGEFNFANFAKAILSPIADACIAAGLMIMTTGEAVEAFKAAFSSLQGYAAIAAGAALIAVGATAKAGLAALASSSSYSSSRTLTSSSSSSSLSNDYATSSMTVNVTGTLVASGSELIAVINNENNRKNHTT